MCVCVYVCVCVRVCRRFGDTAAAAAVSHASPWSRRDREESRERRRRGDTDCCVEGDYHTTSLPSSDLTWLPHRNPVPRQPSALGRGIQGKEGGGVDEWTAGFLLSPPCDGKAGLPEVPHRAVMLWKSLFCIFCALSGSVLSASSKGL